MKKKNLSGLSLNKKTISNLQLNKLLGGDLGSTGWTCGECGTGACGSAGCPPAPSYKVGGSVCKCK